MNSVHFSTDHADVLYNKFNVHYTRRPSVPNNPPQYPDYRNYYIAVATDKDWEVVRYSQSEKHQVVCQEGL